MTDKRLIIYSIASIILLIGLIWIYLRFDYRLNLYEQTRQQRINETIEWLYRAVNDICYQCYMNPIYEIKETSKVTYSVKTIYNNNAKGIINLEIWNEEQGRVFNHNTLIYSVLHEIAHILSPSIEHKPPFDSIESTLLIKARDLQYYDPNIEIEPNYRTSEQVTNF